ncbi:MAG TPA: hypothetical protein VLL76_02445, partial [Candidatus Omnitrophota bacterium]|nr:hypothetical protein [Candidatus Omnitrophota bacterium]
NRSNVPITGRDPVANAVRGPDPAAVQRILDSQGHKNAAPPPTAQAGSQDWFAGAMMKGLDKYEQAARLNRPADAPSVTVQ